MTRFNSDNLNHCDPFCIKHSSERFEISREVVNIIFESRAIRESLTFYSGVVLEPLASGS